MVGFDDKKFNRSSKELRDKILNKTKNGQNNKTCNTTPAIVSFGNKILDLSKLSKLPKTLDITLLTSHFTELDFNVTVSKITFKVPGNNHMEVIKCIPIKEGTTEIDVSDLEPGPYTITWESQTKVLGKTLNLPLTKATLII